MKWIGWLLALFILLFALIGAAPFGGGVFMAVWAFWLSLVPTSRGALWSGMFSFIGLFLALGLTVVSSMRLNTDPTYLAFLSVCVLAFAAAFYRGKRISRQRT